MSLQLVRDSAAGTVRLISEVTLYPGVCGVWRWVECFSYCDLWSARTGCCGSQTNAMGMQKSSSGVTQSHPANLCFQCSEREDFPEETFQSKDRAHLGSCSSPKWECGCMSSQQGTLPESHHGQAGKFQLGGEMSRKEPPH